MSTPAASLAASAVAAGPGLPPEGEAAPRFRPLYSQVYEALVKRIAGGVWRAGEALPSEQALAAQLGVSQGTVRKALDALALDKMIDRRQGKGTFVAEITQEQALFRFFRLTRADGDRAVPASSDETLRLRPARVAEARTLGLALGAEVVDILRTRVIDGRAAMVERVVVPHEVFPGLASRAPLPNALYALYQREFGVAIVSVDEQLRADVARREDARRLGVVLGAPLLQIERVARAVDGRLVEWRLSRCDTTHLTYAVTLS